MKKILALALVAMMSIGAMAQTAKQVLDKTAAVIGNKSGASANFKMSSSKYGSASGSIAIKGNKFNARTPQAIVWFNGKTQWTYLKKTNEVNVSNPTQAQQMSMNPYTFINIYKTGYKSSLKTVGSNYVVHLIANNQKRSVAEMYITINKKTHIPSVVKMRQDNTWSTITVSNFRAKSVSNSTFNFNSKECPGAEVIDLR
jgi:outer membrane lipoprotein-sorting protein